MLLIDCDINLTLTWSANFSLSNTNANQAATFAVTDTIFYIAVVTLSTQDNTSYCHK